VRQEHFFSQNVIKEINIKAFSLLGVLVLLLLACETGIEQAE